MIFYRKISGELGKRGIVKIKKGERGENKEVLKMRSIVSLTLIILLSFLFLSCAAIFKGTNTLVAFESHPQRAKVYVNDEYRGETPLKLLLKSNKTYTIRFEKEGYEPVVRTITNHVQAGWVILDVLGGLIPVVIDASTGAWYELDEKNVNAILDKKK